MSKSIRIYDFTRIQPQYFKMISDSNILDVKTVIHPSTSNVKSNAAKKHFHGATCVQYKQNIYKSVFSIFNDI